MGCDRRGDRLSRPRGSRARFAWEVRALPAQRANPAGGSTVEWRAAFYRGYMLNDPPPELNDAASVKAVTGVLRAGLDHLKAIAEQAR